MPQAQALSVCLYCDSIVRLSPNAAQPAVVERQAAPEDMARIKQLVLSGNHTEAQDRYRQATGASADEAHAAIETLRRQISIEMVRRQQLNAFGWLVIALSALGVVAALVAGLAGALPPLWAVGLALLPASLLLVYAPGIATSLRYLPAHTAPASVTNLTHIGHYKARAEEVHAYRVVLEVRPPEAQPFRAELMLPVRQQSLAQLRPGVLLQVKYLPGDPGSVIFDRHLR
jgi:hypothetical protein